MRDEYDFLDMQSTFDSPWPEAARALYCLMVDISQSSFCAVWYSGIEHELWAAPITDTDFRFGQADIPYAWMRALAALSAACGGWITCGDDGAKWVSLEEFEQLHAAWRKDRANHEVDQR